MKILNLEEAAAEFALPSTPEQWTTVIPAAGRGSRLGYDKPKILYPIAGRPILEWLIDLLEPVSGRLVFVLSPAGVESVAPHVEDRLPEKHRIVVQAEPRGMADAVWQAIPSVNTPYTLVIWGDQVAIRPTTLQATVRTLEHTPEALLVLPLVRRNQPYVHYQTDRSGMLRRVLERREGADMPETGESDCGLFAFRTERLRQTLAAERETRIACSPETREWNLLPLLPRFDTGGRSLWGLFLDSVDESIGANDRDDAARLTAYLGRYSRG